jgi:hypothetical protein
VNLPDAHNREQVARWLTNRSAELYEVVTGQPMPTVGKIIASPVKPKPPQINLNALLTTLATYELQSHYLRQSLENAQTAFTEMKRELAVVRGELDSFKNPVAAA